MGRTEGLGRHFENISESLVNLETINADIGDNHLAYAVH